MMQNASLIKRFGSVLYDGLSLVAIWLLSTFLFEMLVGSHIGVELKRTLLQVFLWGVAGVYFVTCWTKTGQTLAAQTWKVKLVNAEGGLLDVQQAVLRYLLSSLSILVLGVGFLWAFFDKDHLFLHDRLLKTRLIRIIENA